ncbi:MAG TPA: hypothetical protein VFE79_26795 [Paraburkholderia sp.]|nr:hypothetical protein [Paraburkholderia sp.]
MRLVEIVDGRQLRHIELLILKIQTQQLLRQSGRVVRVRRRADARHQFLPLQRHHVDLALTKLLRQSELLIALRIVCSKSTNCVLRNCVRVVCCSPGARCCLRLQIVFKALLRQLVRAVFAPRLNLFVLQRLRAPAIFRGTHLWQNVVDGIGQAHAEIRISNTHDRFLTS